MYNYAILLYILKLFCIYTIKSLLLHIQRDFFKEIYSNSSKASAEKIPVS